MVSQYRQQIDNLMRHEVSRGQFLQYTGMALLGFVGVIGFIKSLHEVVPAKASIKKRSSSSGYGGSAYGR